MQLPDSPVRHCVPLTGSQAASRWQTTSPSLLFGTAILMVLMYVLVMPCSVPVKSAEMRLPNSTDWEWVPHSEGRWQITSPVDPLAFPLPIRLTSVLGDVVTDTIDSSIGGQVCERNEEKHW